MKDGCIRNHLPLFPLQTAGVPKSLRPPSRGTIAPPSISALSPDRSRTASAIPENRSVKSAPRRLEIFARSPSLPAGTQKPSWFTSCPRGFEPLTSAVQAPARLTGSRLPFLRGSSATARAWP